MKKYTPSIDDFSKLLLIGFEIGLIVKRPSGFCFLSVGGYFEFYFIGRGFFVECFVFIENYGIIDVNKEILVEIMKIFENIGKM